MKVLFKYVSFPKLGIEMKSGDVKSMDVGSHMPGPSYEEKRHQTTRELISEIVKIRQYRDDLFFFLYTKDGKAFIKLAEEDNPETPPLESPYYVEMTPDDGESAEDICLEINSIFHPRT